MFYQEKQTIVSLASTILISLFYCANMLQRYQERSANAADDFQFLASAALLLIPVLIVSKIVIYILFSIVNTVVTRQEEPSVKDELDQLINLKATRNFYHVFMAGFVLSLGSAAIGQPPVVMFSLLLLSMIVSGVTLDVSQLYFYRRGV